MYSVWLCFVAVSLETIALEDKNQLPQLCEKLFVNEEQYFDNLLFLTVPVWQLAKFKICPFHFREIQFPRK